MVKPNLIALTKLAVLSRVNLPNSPQKLAIAKAFAEANYVFFAFASAIFLPRRLISSKICFISVTFFHVNYLTYK